MQEQILLGFLFEKPLTGYSIRKQMLGTTDFFFNTSLGSIYPALKRLQSDGYVEQTEKIIDGRVNKIYQITQKGINSFQQWISQDIGHHKIKEESLLRIFFFKHLSKYQRDIILNKYLDELETEKTQLEKASEKTLPGKENEFLLETLKFGIDYYNFKIQWIKHLLGRIMP